MIDQRKLVVISGPSGSGKDTVSAMLRDSRSDIYISISCTTRPPRGAEQNGKDYFFISEDEFRKRLDDGRMIEYTCYAGKYYGTPMDEIEQQISEGKTVILVIDTNGGANIKKLYPDSMGVFISPPSLEILEERLRGRGTENEEQIRQRLSIAKKELELSGLYDFSLINDDLSLCVQQLSDLIDKWQLTEDKE